MAKVKSWLVYNIANASLTSVIQKYTRGKLVDISCGKKHTEGQTKSYITEHIGLDCQKTLRDTSNIELSGTAYRIPVKDEHFDIVLCTAVLEHLEEPDTAVKETNRVLGKGGYAICTAPVFWHLHKEPRDFYRYTKYSLRYLFYKNGFEIMELKPLSGF